MSKIKTLFLLFISIFSLSYGYSNDIEDTYLLLGNQIESSKQNMINSMNNEINKISSLVNKIMIEQEKEFLETLNDLNVPENTKQIALINENAKQFIETQNISFNPDFALEKAQKLMELATKQSTLLKIIEDTSHIISSEIQEKNDAIKNFTVSHAEETMLCKYVLKNVTDSNFLLTQDEEEDIDDDDNYNYSETSNVKIEFDFYENKIRKNMKQLKEEMEESSKTPEKIEALEKQLTDLSELTLETIKMTIEKTLDPEGETRGSSECGSSRKSHTQRPPVRRSATGD